jgi:hypothetical protein
MNGAYSQIPPEHITVKTQLRYGNTVLAAIIPDSQWPGMYRIHWRDGSVGDLGNLTRTRDAAFVVAARDYEWRRLRWERAPTSEAPKSPLVDFPAEGAVGDFIGALNGHAAQEQGRQP